MATKKKQPENDEFPFQGGNSAKRQAAKRMAKAFLKGQYFNTTNIRPKRLVDAVLNRLGMHGH